MKKIRRTIRTTSDKQIEALPLFLERYPKYSKYFKIIMNHSSILLRDNAKTGQSLLIYCTLASSSIHVKEVGEYSFVQNKYFDSSALDGFYPPSVFKTTVEDTLHPSLISAIAIYLSGIEVKTCTGVKRVLVGWFLIEPKTLILCDMTHSDGCLVDETLPAILDRLINEKLLTPIRRRAEKKEPKFPKVSVTIGADPEFEHIVNGKIRNATVGFFGDIPERDVASWGVDGSGYQIEARPKPAKTPEQAVRHMRRLFSKVVAHKMTVAGNVYPLGGHLHVGGICFSESSDEQLIELYDNMIGNPTKSMNGRARGEYKGMSLYRAKEYGFEYRTPPSAIFYHPRMAELCYKIIKNTADKWFSQEEHTFHDQFEDNLVEWANFTAMEVDEYKAYIKNYEGKMHNVVASWLDIPEDPIKADLPASPIEVHFSSNDTWNEPMFEVLRQELIKIKSKEYSAIYFYGLAERRGNVVSGIELEGHETIENRLGPSNAPVDSLIIGLPYAMRVNGSFDIVKLISAIKKEIK
jgi:hypothetical protein